jgi:hypothetical protein
MKTNRLVAGVLALNLLLLALAGYLWMTSHDEPVAAAAVRPAGAEYPPANTSPFHDRLGSKETQADAPPDAAQAQPVSPQPGQLQTPDVEPVSLPLVFQEPDPKADLSDEELARWDSLRETFIKAVGGIYQNPNDPQYLSRWEKAKPQVDAQFKALFGEALYIELQTSAERQAWQQSVQH